MGVSSGHSLQIDRGAWQNQRLSGDQLNLSSFKISSEMETSDHQEPSGSTLGSRDGLSLHNSQLLSALPVFAVFTGSLEGEKPHEA